VVVVTGRTLIDQVTGDNGIMVVPNRVAIPAVLVWLLVVPAVLWAMVRSAGLERGPLLVQVMAFTPYAAALSPIPLVVALVARNWWAAGVAGLAVVALAVAVVPRAVPHGNAGSGDEARLVVMSVNLRVGGADARSIVDLVRAHGVDVLAVQEYTGAAQAALAAAGLTDLLPYGELHPTDNAAGSGVYSRLPVSDGVTVRGVWFHQSRVVVHPGGRAVTVESAHPPPPVSQAGSDWAEGLREQTPATEPGLRVLAGDFNATLDHAELRRLIGTGYRDAAATVGAGLRATWPFYGPRTSVTPKVTIDHVLVNGTIGVDSYGAFTVPRTDHRAIVATLRIP
jgi:endonuclease/exonuclease/phosphatase family metal-dependent hydrolase